MKPRTCMQSNRYHHSAIYDSKRLRIYVFGGLGQEKQTLIPNFESSLEYNPIDDQRLSLSNPQPLSTSEYYDLKSDTWT